jgi:diguanylate cyclase (GGDEF)-like protein/PAS domain S-box-containing protein
MQMRLNSGNLADSVLLFATLLTAVAILALAVMLDAYERQELLQHRAADMANKFHQSEIRLRQTIDTLRRDVIFLSKTPPVAGIQRALANHGIDARDGNSIEVWKKRLEEIFAAFIETKPYYSQARYIGLDGNGRELVRVHEEENGRIVPVPPQELQAKGESDWFGPALSLEKGEVHLSRFDLNLEHGEVSMPLQPTLRAATPVFMADGRISGIIVINMSTEGLLDEINRGLPQGVLTYLASDQGDFLTHPDSQRRLGFWQGSPDAWQNEMRELMMKPDGNHANQHLQPVSSPQGMLHVIAGEIHFDPLQPQRKLLLAYALPDAQVQEEMFQVRLRIVLGAFILLAMVVVATTFLLSRIFAPLRGLSAAAQAIATGRYDAPVPEIRDGEVSVLADALRDMQAKVAAREGELRSLASDLESRVAARTADLQLAASVFHNTTEGVVVADADTRIISINPAFTDITGYTPEEAIGKKTSLLRSDRQSPEFYEELWQRLNLLGNWQGEIWNRRKSGEVYLEWLTINRIVDAKGEPYRYVGVFHDITDTHRKSEQIRHLAYHDALTGLPNRLLLEDRLKQSMAAARREEVQVGLMFIDLDRFKEVNDTLGHSIGDKLLEDVALRLGHGIRDADTVARLGGDEFVILLPKLNARADIARLAEKLISSLMETILIAGHPIRIGASIGIALFPDDGSTPDELMHSADAAMYAAKSAGRGTYRFIGDVQAR